MRKVFFSISLAAIAASATAQCFDQPFGTSLGPGPDIMFPMQPIGFAFPFCGTTYTDIHITDKGYVHLSNAGVPSNTGYADITADPLDLIAGAPLITCLWSDIQCNSFTNPNAQVYVKSTPTTYTITWFDAQCYSQTSGLFNMQLQLSINGTITMLFGPGTTNASVATVPTWFAGLVGVSPGTGTLPAGSDVSAGGATTNDILFEAFLAINSFDMPNNGLQLIPTNPGWAFVPLGAPVNCASASNYGVGCMNAYDSVHEYMGTNAFDLGGATLTFLRTPTGYLLFNSIPGTFVTPSAAAQVVADFDDIEQVVALPSAMPVANGTTTSLAICSNGRIALSGAMNNGAGYFPDEQQFLSFPDTTICADWHDYNPSAGGDIKFEVVGGIAYVTWDAVFSFGTSTPHTFQYQFNLTTGDCTIVYSSPYTLAGNDHIVGYHVGGQSLSNLVVDMSALAAPVVISDVGVTPLALTNVGTPFLGNPAFTLQASNVPAVLPLGFMFFGDTAINPGIDLSFIGMAGCSAYTNGNLGSLTFPVAGGTGSVSFGIPNSPALVGASLSAQTLAFSPATALGLISSNGNLFTVGN